MKTVRLQPGRERSLLRRHPWVFESAVASGRADSGETVRLVAADGRFLAWAAWSAKSAIRLRAWSFAEDERIDAAFFERRLAAALALRTRLAVASDALRLVHGEADGLPGLVVDRYGDTLSAQFLSAGVERWKPVLTAALMRSTGARRLYERSDTSARAREGLPACTGWLAGDGATEVAIREHGWALTVDVGDGHKTGCYLDQRDNRAFFAAAVRRLGCAHVFNGYAYTGGFALAALDGGAARVLSVDSSAPALARAEAHVRANGHDPRRHETLVADDNSTLRAAIARGERYDAIVLDPPKFAPTVAHAERAARAYKDINRLALVALEPGGLLCTFSCSGGIGIELFRKIVAGAAVDAGADATVLQRLQAAPDHPSTLLFPEGDYLKGLALLRR